MLSTYMLTAFTSLNFDSLNIIGIILFAVIMFTLGRLSHRTRWIWLISIIIVLATLYGFAVYDWA